MLSKSLICDSYLYVFLDMVVNILWVLRAWLFPKQDLTTWSKNVTWPLTWESHEVVTIFWQHIWQVINSQGKIRPHKRQFSLIYVDHLTLHTCKILSKFKCPWQLLWQHQDIPGHQFSRRKNTPRHYLLISYPPPQKYWITLGTNLELVCLPLVSSAAKDRSHLPEYDGRPQI